MQPERTREPEGEALPVDDTAVKNGGKIRVKGNGWSINLTITQIAPDSSLYITKVNKKGIYTNVSFVAGAITYFQGKARSRVDYCSKGAREAYRGPPPDQPHTVNPVLESIKAQCVSEWPGDYTMMKYCIDRQVKAYNELLDY